MVLRKTKHEVAPGEKIESVLSHATAIGQYKMQIADRLQNADCRLGTKRRHRIKTVFRLIRDNMSSKNIPSVTQSLFRGHLSPTLALLWNILVSSYILSLTKRPGHRLFICCTPDLPADLRISERPPF